MRQKPVSLGINFTIKDGDGNDAFRLNGEAARFGNKFSLQDLVENELVQIERTTWSTTYELSRNGRRLAAVKRVPFSIRRHIFSIDALGAPNLEADGDFLDRKIIVRRGGRAIARLTKRWFRLTDTFDIQIDDSEKDQIFVLAVAIAIELTAQNYHNN